MSSLEKSGRTVEEATNAALKELGLKFEDVEIMVLNPGSKGILGLIGGKPAKILVTKKFNPQAIAKTFLEDIALSMGLSIEIETTLSDRQMTIELKGEKIGVFIGKRGQTLDSLQYILNLVVNKGDAPFINIILDAENYRKRRKETLESLAFNLARKVKQTKKDIVLEPMNSYERRIIHFALQNNKDVFTHSEGEEPFRNIIISPAANKEKELKKDKK